MYSRYLQQLFSSSSTVCIALKMILVRRFLLCGSCWHAWVKFRVLFPRCINIHENFTFVTFLSFSLAFYFFLSFTRGKKKLYGNEIFSHVLHVEHTFVAVILVVVISFNFAFLAASHWRKFFFISYVAKKFIFLTNIFVFTFSNYNNIVVLRFAVA